MRPGGRTHIENVEEAGKDSDQHAYTGDENPRWRRHRRRHTLEAVHEKKRGREIDDTNNELSNAGHGQDQFLTSP